MAICRLKFGFLCFLFESLYDDGMKSKLWTRVPAVHSVARPRGCSEWQHTGMAGATVAPVVSVAACCSPWLPHLEQIAAQTLPETLRFQRNAGPTAGTRAGCWAIFVLYFIKISFLSLFILKGTISGCPRGTQVGADRPVYPGVSRVGSPLAPQSTGMSLKGQL